ncbi:MAG: cyclic pyranopterin monophosphate synthase MoaC [Candidatus Kapaibacterium sp.]
MKSLTHVNTEGKAEMVDVSTKGETLRTAIAYGEIRISNDIYNAIKNNEIKKGDVLTLAKIAGIMGAKKTSELIPLCHNIFISKLDVELKLEKDKITANSFASTIGPTGIEMEALSAVSIALLTIYDMCKAIAKDMLITNIQLIEKTGGKSGNYYKDLNNEN